MPARGCGRIALKVCGFHPRRLQEGAFKEVRKWWTSAPPPRNLATAEARAFRGAGALKALFSSAFSLGVFTVGKAGSISRKKYWNCAFMHEKQWVTGVIWMPPFSVRGIIVSAITVWDPKLCLASAYTEILSWTASPHIVLPQGQLLMFPRLPSVRYLSGEYEDTGAHVNRQRKKDQHLLAAVNGLRAFSLASYEESVRRIGASDSAWIVHGLETATMSESALQVTCAQWSATTYRYLFVGAERDGDWSKRQKADRKSGSAAGLQRRRVQSAERRSSTSKSRTPIPTRRIITGDYATTRDLHVIRTEALVEDTGALLSRLNSTAAANVQRRCGKVDQANVGIGRRRRLVNKDHAAFTSSKQLEAFIENESALMRSVCRSNYHDYNCFGGFDLPRACDERHYPDWVCKL
ncbi:hypothetical protein T492DRAFT_844725 [Pavlovales sp. CCMP2436]|nr:hypothetical protein T492DRAFT_844725 [Pavlovales sp. CCMP2436]